MKKGLIKALCEILALSLLLSVLPTVSFAADSNVTKYVDSYTAGSGSFTLKSDAKIYVVTDSEPTGTLLSTLKLSSSLLAAKNIPSAAALNLSYGSEDQIRQGDIVVRKDNALEEEGYRLVVTTSNITVYYSEGQAQTFYNGEGSHNGLLYAFHTLIKLMNGSNTLSACTISDAPDTKERTVQLDIGRKYWSVNWIKNLIDEMSWMGYNAMDLHLTEDQGCRANIWQDANGNRVNDANGNDFNWLIGYNTVSWNTSYTDPNANKFYNRDELIEIVNYAKSRHIEIIPAVDFPTHADCVIAKFKSNFVDTGKNFSFNLGGTTYSGHGSLAGGNDATINIGDDYARNLSFALTDGYAKFFGEFGCTKFNIGGDEVSGASYTWASSSFNTSNGGSTSNYKDPYVIYMNKLAEMLQKNNYGGDKHSYRVRAWNDCLFGTGYYCYLPSGSRPQYTTAATVPVNSGIDVLFWTALTSHDSPNTLANQGRKVYNCINWYTYYVLRLSGSSDARDESCTAWTFNHSSAQRVYSGCGSCSTYSSYCKHSGGWNPSDFNGVTVGHPWTADCFTDQYRTDAQLGGGYFLIWGDWAGVDTEENIWNRSGSYNLIKRMWANAAKQWNWDVDGSLAYTSFDSMTSSFLTFPGFKGCTQEASFPQSGELQGDGVTIYLKADMGGTEKLLDTIQLDTKFGESFTYEVPNVVGFTYSHVEGASFAENHFGANSGILSGVVNSAGQKVTVWYENTPYLDGLSLVLDNPVEDDGYANYAAYKAAYDEAQAFYNSVVASPKTRTTQEEVNEKFAAVLRAKIALAKATNGETKLDCSLGSRYVLAGRVAVIQAESTGDITALRLTAGGQDADLISIASRMNSDGTKSWMLKLLAPKTTGNYTYTVIATTLNGTKTAAVDVTVK